MTLLSSPDELQQRVQQLRWYHTIDLGTGVVTPGLFDPREKVARYGIPDSLRGKTVLDIGAWDGFWSFEAERRGADRVLATDSFSWNGSNWGSKAGFELARQVLGSKVEDRMIDVLDLAPDNVGMFDVVLFLGVLYHMRHPMLALDRVASVTREMLILETHTDLSVLRRPALAFYPGREHQDDPTNWFGPNQAAVIAMLRAAGFSRVDVFNGRSYGYRVAKQTYLRLRKRSSRMIFHAWK